MQDRWRRKRAEGSRPTFWIRRRGKTGGGAEDRALPVDGDTLRIGRSRTSSPTPTGAATRRCWTVMTFETGQYELVFFAGDYLRASRGDAA
jgi:hypothetical protein